jgi:RimJ/RimL family protein N-acetyltransferase
MASAPVTFERTHDLSFVASVYTLPNIWPWIGDDYAPDQETFQAHDDPRIVYLGCREEDAAVGLFTFLPQNTVCWEGHIILLPRRKTRGHVILRGALDWMFKNTTAQRIVGAVPAYNRLTVNLLQRAGMTQYGVNPRSFQKNGRLEDQVLFGLSKEV